MGQQLRVDFHIPKDWSVLTEEQLLFYVKELLLGQSREQLLLLCLLHFNDVEIVKKPWKKGVKSERLFRKSKQLFRISKHDMRTLCESLSWLTDSVGYCTNLKMIGDTTACNADLSDVTVEQYLLGDYYYSCYMMSSDVRYLQLLTAVFYTKDNEPFDHDTIEEYSDYYKLFPAEIQLVFIWYGGTKHLLAHEFPYLFTGGSKSDEQQDPRKNIRDMLSALTDNHPIDNDKAEKLNLYVALDSLEKKVKSMPKH